jgi:outer membrane protein assembly factor BamB
MIAMELKTGKILWQKWIDSDVMTAPVAKDDLLYVATFSGAIYKFRERTGEIIEAKATRATSAPVFSHNGELVYSQRSDSIGSEVSEVIVSVYGKNRKSIFKKRALYLDKNVQSTSKLKDEAKLMDAGNGFTSGAPESANYAAAQDNIGLSNVSSLQSFQGSRGVYANYKLYNTMGDELVCTDTSGQVVWKQKLEGDLTKEGGFIGTPPVYANGHIIVATLKGEVFLLNDKNGELIKTYHIKDPVRYQPLAWDGWIYVTTTNGKLHAINTGNKSITGWRMWGGNAARTNVASVKLP